MHRSSQRGGPPGPRQKPTITDGDGRFETTLPASMGKMRIAFQASGYYPVTRMIGFDGEATAEVALDRDAIVEGRVTLAPGVSSPSGSDGVHVTFSTPGVFGVLGSSRRFVNATAAKDGTYVFRTPLRRGKWTAQAAGSGGLFSEPKAIVVVGSDMTVDLELKSGGGVEAR